MPVVPQCSSPRVSTAPCSRRPKRATGACTRFTSAPGSRGKPRSSPRSIGCCAHSAVCRPRGAARAAGLHGPTISIPPTHWALRGEPPAFDTPDEDVYLTGRNVVLLSKAAIYCAQPPHRPHRARPARRQSVSRRHARVLRDDGARAVARPRPADRGRRTVCLDGQERRDPARRRARRAAGADAVVHESAGRAPLRPVQQVPRAPRRVRRGRRRRSDDLRGAPLR